MAVAESKLYTGFEAPSILFMADTASASTAVLLSADSVVLGRDFTNKFYFAWHAKDRTYQIRWRYRHRKYPTASSSGGWAGWSSWQGADTCSTKTARTTLVTPLNTQNPNTWLMANARNYVSSSSTTNLYGANQTGYVHAVPIDIGPNLGSSNVRDAEQYQVQVRTWGEGNQMHGPHKERTFTVFYQPTSFVITSVKLNDADGLRVYYTTDWNRDGNSVVVRWQDGSTSTVASVKGGLNGTYFTIPSSKLDKDYDVGDAFSPASVRLVTADSEDAWKEASFSSGAHTVQPLYSSALPNPTLQVQANHGNHLATVTLSQTQTGASYSWKTVTVWAGWYDPNGKWVTVGPSKVVSEENYESTGGSGQTLTRKGIYQFNNVPSDIAIAFRAKVCSAADSEGLTVKATSSTSNAWGTDYRGRTGTILRSLGMAVLSIGESMASLRVNSDTPGVTFSRSYAPNVEAEMCAGRQREVSRHGVGGKASIQVKGALIRESLPYDLASTGRVSDWEKMKLKTGADGYLSMPDGVWAKVAVSGIDIDYEHPLHSVTLDLEEVV